MNYFVYIVKCSDGTYYCGSTNKLSERISKHNSLKSGAKYTKYRRPVKLVYSEQLPNKSKALKREYEIKQLSRAAKTALITHQTNRAPLGLG